MPHTQPVTVHDLATRYLELDLRTFGYARIALLALLSAIEATP